MGDRLFSLIHAGSLRQLQLVLECGCEIDCKNGRHETPLMVAMISIQNPKRRRAVVQILAHSGANINCQNIRGQTPLMYACVLNQADTLYILMGRKDLDYNMQDYEGNTALMYACSMGNTAVVKQLVEAHKSNQITLDFDVTNSDRLTALLFARDCLHDSIVQLLQSAMPDERPGRSMCYRENENELQLGYASGAEEMADTVESSLTNGKSGVSTDTATNQISTDDTTSSPEAFCCQQSASEIEDSLTGNETAQPHITHLLEEKDACVERLLDIADKRNDDFKNVLEINAMFVKEPVNMPAKKDPICKKSKRGTNHGKGKGKKRKTDDHTVTTDERNATQDYTADEFSADAQAVTGNSNNDTQEDNDVTLIRRIVMDNAKRELYKTLSLEREEPFVELDTGKIDCLNLEPEDRARLLGRTVWSVYGAPLPPIPVDENAVKRIVEEISEVKQYLGNSSCREGRLMNLDPELWCIITSMRTSE